MSRKYDTKLKINKARARHALSDIAITYMRLYNCEIEDTWAFLYKVIEENKSQILMRMKEKLQEEVNTYA